MRKNKWIFYFLYAVVIVCYMTFSNKILISLNEEVMRSFNSLSLIIWSTIIFIGLGLLIGLEKFLLEMRKEGHWRINLPRIIFLGLPSLYFSVGIFIAFLPINFTQRILSSQIIFFSKYTNFISIFQMILGYIIITSFIKDKN